MVSAQETSKLEEAGRKVGKPKKGLPVDWGQERDHGVAHQPIKSLTPLTCQFFPKGTLPGRKKKKLRKKKGGRTLELEIPSPSVLGDWNSGE